MDLGMQVEISFEVLMAALFTAIIGMDREFRHTKSSAGLRTHMLVGVGACLFTALSAHGFGRGDPSRVAAQVVTALGFLGGGMIIQRKDAVKNLTTATDIWVTAAIGMTVGVGAYILALVTTLITWIILAVVRRAEPKRNGNGNGNGKNNDDDDCRTE